MINSAMSAVTISRGQFDVFESYVASEEEEQAALFEWAAWKLQRWPELGLLFHIPNGGLRNKVTAAKLKNVGVKAGVPDLFLPVARGDWHGLFIEMKRRKGGKLSPLQVDWIEALGRQGYKTVVCFGADAAEAAIEDYLCSGDGI